MSVLIPELQQTIVSRLLHEHFHEIQENVNMCYFGDLTFLELQEQLILLESVYATKILEAVLE